MSKWMVGFLDRCFILFGALFFAQAPLFIQQYTQQLAARASELKIQADAIRRSASVSGKTAEQLIQKFIESSDGDFSRQGEAMQTLIIRWQNLHEALIAMQESSIWSRPFSFLYYCDAETFSGTFHHFTLGLPLNLEGGIYALLGMGVGYLIFVFFKFICKMIFPSRRKNEGENRPLA